MCVSSRNKNSVIISPPTDFADGYTITRSTSAEKADEDAACQQTPYAKQCTVALSLRRAPSWPVAPPPDLLLSLDHREASRDTWVHWDDPWN